MATTEENVMDWYSKGALGFLRSRERSGAPRSSGAGTAALPPPLWCVCLCVMGPSNGTKKKIGLIIKESLKEWRDQRLF